MRNRVISFFLCVVLLMSLVVVAPAEASAMSDMKCSEDGIALLKQFEAYSKYPYEDNGLYYVGYGCYIPKEEVAYYQENGISEEEADALLIKYLDEMIPNVIKFANKHNLYYTQSEFDALMIFTYNVGTNWMWEESDLRTAVINGVRGTDFVYYLTRWCTSGGKILTGLVNRRLCEADMFLNGNYSKTVPSYYSYVLLDANGGSCVSSIQGYDAAETAKIKVSATWEGKEFLGWYTAKEGGRRVTDLDKTTAKQKLYAHWQEPESQGVAAEYQRIVKTKLDVYSLDGKGTVVETLKAGDQVTITLDYMDKNGILWGKTEKGWVQLDATRQALSPATKPAQSGGVAVTITADGLRIRKGPGTNYDAVAIISRGNKVVITDVVSDGKLDWGHYSGGWICLQYTNYAEVAKPEETEPETTEPETTTPETKPEDTQPEETTPATKPEDTKPEDTKPEEPTPDQQKQQTGTVSSKTTLNVRKAPGIQHEKVDSLMPGTQVTILETANVDNMVWGRINQGWVCMQYIQLDQPTADTSKPNSGSTGIATGTVTGASALRVRRGPGTSHPQVGVLNKGTKVTILDTTVVGGVSWGRIEQGWICLSYVQMQSGNLAYSARVTASALRIRSGPGTSNTLVGGYVKGQIVTILETKKVNGTQWGRTDKGWISLDYVKR